MADTAEYATPEFEALSAPPLEITARVIGGEATLAIHGEIDLDTTEILLTCLERIVGHTRGPVTVDLAGVTFLDSSGIKALVRAHNKLCALDRRLVLCNPRGFVRRTFAIARLDSLVEIQDALSA